MLSVTTELRFNIYANNWFQDWQVLQDAYEAGSIFAYCDRQQGGLEGEALANRVSSHARETHRKVRSTYFNIFWPKPLVGTTHLKNIGAAAIAQWFCLRLPSSSPGFESQARHLYYWNWNEKRTKINEKEAGIGPYLK